MKIKSRWCFISYWWNKKIIYSEKDENIPRGKYIVGFTPYINEADYNEYYECAADFEMFGEQVPTKWYPEEYFGKTSNFVFIVNDWFDNC